MAENITLEIPYEQCYDCPEGNLRSTLFEARSLEKLTPNGTERLIRLIFAPELPRLGNKIILAGKNFLPSMAAHSPLKLYLESWLGKEFLEQHRGQQINLKKLEGRAADIKTVHIRNATHAKPFVDIQGIYPPGTLTPTHGVRNQKEMVCV